MHGGRVIATLAGDDGLAAAERLEIVRARQRRVAARRLAAGVRGTEEQRRDPGEIVLGSHPIHQHRPYHPAPADEADPSAHAQTVALSHLSLPFAKCRSPDGAADTARLRGRAHPL
jgi:hypothetical protein